MQQRALRNKTNLQKPGKNTLTCMNRNSYCSCLPCFPTQSLAISWKASSPATPSDPAAAPEEVVRSTKRDPDVGTAAVSIVSDAWPV